MANPKRNSKCFSNFQTSKPNLQSHHSPQILPFGMVFQYGWGLWGIIIRVGTCTLDQFILKSFDELQCSIHWFVSSMTSVSIFCSELAAIIYVQICHNFISRDYQWPGLPNQFYDSPGLSNNFPLKTTRYTFLENNFSKHLKSFEKHKLNHFTKNAQFFFPQPRKTCGLTLSQALYSISKHSTLSPITLNDTSNGMAC